MPKPTIQDFFKWGLDREIPDLIDPPVLMDRNRRKWSRSELEPLEANLPGATILPHLNLGPGDRKVIPGTIGVGPLSNKLTDVHWTWDGLTRGGGPRNALPFDDRSIGAVHVHQFMEHFAVDDALGILREIERVLVPGGVVFMTTPYPGHGHFTQALDHKTMWTEETWNWLFQNTYYESSGPWLLKVHACFMMGIVYRNLDLFTQLVKEG